MSLDNSQQRGKRELERDVIVASSHRAWVQQTAQVIVFHTGRLGLDPLIGETKSPHLGGGDKNPENRSGKWGGKAGEAPTWPAGPSDWIQRSK